MVINHTHEYDVVIMGAGFAGVCQARHLLLTVPNIKVALIDPRPEERTNKDLKIGESMQMRQEFANYRYQPKLNAWLEDTTTKTDKKEKSLSMFK